MSLTFRSFMANLRWTDGAALLIKSMLPGPKWARIYGTLVLGPMDSLSGRRLHLSRVRPA
jgi:hypothetical protein